MGLVYLPKSYHKKSTIPVWHGCRTQNSLGDFSSKAWKIGSLCGNLQIEESEATLGHNLSVKNHWNSIAKESSSQDLREQIWGSNRFKCHEHFDFVATTKHLTNVRLLWPLQTISQLQPYRKGHLGHRFHQLWNWSHLWLVSTTDLKAPLVCSLEHDTHWTWCKRQQKRLQPHRRVVWIIEPPNSEICNVTGWKQIGAIFRSWQCYRWLTAHFRNAVGPRMHFSAHVQTVTLRWFSTDFKLEHEWLDFTWIRILFMYSSRCLFLWMVQRKFAFLNLKRGDGTTQELVSGAFRVCKFQSGLLAKYFILAKWLQLVTHTHTQTSARLGEISHFEFHICFKYIGHMASSTKKCDHETSSFCVAFGSLGFFLTSTFPAWKHHQPCILLQSASQLQLSIGAFGTTQLQKLLVCVLESRLLSMDGATQIPISEFEASRWHNSWVCVWRFQGL